MNERVLRALLRLYPRRFRERFGDEILAFHRERRGDPSARTWPAIADLIRTAAMEQFASRRARRSSIAPDPRPLSGDGMLHTLMHDARFALRGMRRRPAFAAVVLATLALGIGANAAIFSLVDGVLLRPLPFTDVDRIVHARHQDPYGMTSEPEFMDYKRDVKAFETLAAYAGAIVTLSGDARTEPERAEVARVSHGFFSVLGAKPLLGRTFTAAEDVRHAPRVVVLGYGLWRRRFGADPRIVGRTIAINDVPVTVVGVMPRGAEFPTAETSLWVPLRLDPDSLWTRNNHYLEMVGKLAPGATIEQARAQMRALSARWMVDYPETYTAGHPLVAVVSPLRDKMLGQTRPYLLALLGAVAFVLLIACVNVANLLLARGESRRKELAIRTALGAARATLVRQVLVESALYAIIGGAIGFVVAWWGTRGILALAPADIPRIDQVQIDGRVLAFTFLVSLATGLVFGFVPAMRGSHADSAGTLREGGKTSGLAGSMKSARGALVVAEVALAVVTLTGAGLMLRSLWSLQAVELGFDPSHVLTMQLALPAPVVGVQPLARDDQTARTVAYYQQVVERVKGLPGVEHAAAVNDLPVADGYSSWSIFIDGHVVKTIAEAPSATPEPVTPDYFRTMRIGLVRGRTFTDADREGAPYVAVINETMARKLWPGQDPVGHTLKMFNERSPWVTIVGVVRDVHVARDVRDEIPPTMYFPHAQAGTSAYVAPRDMSLVIRTTGAPADIAPSVRAAVRAIDAHVPISKVRTMDDVLASSMASRRFGTALVGLFALLAVVLAGVGIYGVIAYGVSQRTYEIGLRMALGAQRSSVVALVMSQGMRMAMLGLALGVVGALGVARLLRSVLVGVALLDLPTLGAVTLVLAAVAAIACLVPARRASVVSPTEALRSE